jgi:molecular chaperone GrpE
MTSKKKSIDPEPLEPDPQDIDIEAEEPEEPLEEMDPIELLNAQLNSKDEELAEQRKAYQRLQADTENFKKRLRKEKEDFAQYANEKLLKELLHIHDNMERALWQPQRRKPQRRLGHDRETILHFPGKRKS